MGRRGPNDTLTEECSALIYAPSATRDRITGRLFQGGEGDGIDLLNRCYVKVVEMEPVMKRLRDAKKTPLEAREAGLISDAEMTKLAAMNDLVTKVVAVDDYTPKALAYYFPDLDAPRDDPDENTNPREAAE